MTGPDLRVPARFAGITQVAFVVHDLERSVRAYQELLGIGPWTAYELGPELLEDAEYLGEPCSFGLRHALAWQGDRQFELVQPTEGPSIFADHLAEHGEGLHHVGIYVPDHATAVAEMVRDGFRLLQRARGFGQEGDGAFAYFSSSDPGLPAVVELIEAPAVRRPPLFVHPAPAEHTKESR
jgi:catechol 2,3-dioxygenase-like lactoylglutathione lyase family enzyme